MKVKFINLAGEQVKLSARELHIPSRGDKILLTFGWTSPDNKKKKYVVEDVILDYDLMVASVYVSEV